ncbi:zinc metalloproteinase nas-4 [Eurytemora carolleeae]|uniref:zinc metalloproteinase nas-4 n=1 Tax=Eurytemora carolleeae TaxID=1294199 RepID=UPI000C765393|nr:zinc metalloproteinase nas-4 [Eurytemora carolleeae]|eukprot:XP_023324289.1 zinc metalloproteinase nas-4-like [Eurytemora affinis]
MLSLVGARTLLLFTFLLFLYRESLCNPVESQIIIEKDSDEKEDFFPHLPNLPEEKIMFAVEENTDWMEDLAKLDTTGYPLEDWEVNIWPRNHDYLFLKSNLDQDNNLLEGDIAGVRLEVEGNNVSKNALLVKRWENSVVPYVISSRYSFWERGVIVRGLNEVEQKTCLSIRPRISEENYIHILPGAGCYSSIGSRGGVQVLSLGSGCVHQGIVVHELLHALGLWHEQSRMDRDRFVKIYWKNILTGREDQFARYRGDLFNQSYDYTSIMHYGPTAFSRNGEKTIAPITGWRGNMGQRSGMTNLDLEKINTLYSCNMTIPISGAQPVLKKINLFFISSIFIALYRLC